MFPGTCYTTEVLVVLAGKLYFEWDGIKSFQMFSNSTFTYEFDSQRTAYRDIFL
jgi:hypothetical protein